MKMMGGKNIKEIMKDIDPNIIIPKNYRFDKLNAIGINSGINNIDDDGFYFDDGVVDIPPNPSSNEKLIFDDKIYYHTDEIINNDSSLSNTEDELYKTHLLNTYGIDDINKIDTNINNDEIIDDNKKLKKNNDELKKNNDILVENNLNLTSNLQNANKTKQQLDHTLTIKMNILRLLCDL